MTEPTTSESTPTLRPHQLRLLIAAALFTLALVIVLIGPGGAAPPTAPSDKEPTIDGQALFASWPDKGQRKPDAAIVLTGQTFGLLQPCGCSRPQKGGLERRMQFIASLKAKGWPVAGVDLGEIYPDKTSFTGQGLLRYKTTMNALREMGYIAVGVGKTEFSAELDKVLFEYAAQKQQPPFVLAGNLTGDKFTREERFPVPQGATRPILDMVEVATVGQVSVGVAGIVGKSLAEEIEKAKLDPSVSFVKVNGKLDNAGVLKTAVAALAAKKSQLNVLIYQGTPEEAELLAKAWPEFHVILCRADDPEPPATAARVNNGKTAILKVGEKGRYVGVLGAFRNGAGFDLHYQIVPLDEYYITPGKDDDARKANKILPMLDAYAAEVRDADFLTEAAKSKRPHAAQVAEPNLNLRYVGSEACKACHAAEYDVWKKSTHSHALDTLEKVAKRPNLRNFDPECVRCHTVGFDHDTGYVDAKKTPELKHVGCENCHGPGSGHAADPKAQKLHLHLSPWKRGQPGKLPAELIKKMAETPAVERGKIAVQPAEQFMINLASATCGKCHDPDNDPHFDFYTYWPKVNHTGLAPPGGRPAVPPKK